MTFIEWLFYIAGTIICCLGFAGLVFYAVAIVVSPVILFAIAIYGLIKLKEN